MLVAMQLLKIAKLELWLTLLYEFVEIGRLGGTFLIFLKYGATKKIVTSSLIQFFIAMLIEDTESRPQISISIKF